MAIGKTLPNLKPMGDGEWSVVAEKLQASDLRRPGALLGKSEADLRGSLGLGAETCSRIVALLSRGGQLAIELERLSSMGIWVMTRADDDYPKRLKKRLRQRAPVVLFGMGPRHLLSTPGLAVVGSRDLDDTGLLYATEAGRRAADAACTVYSGASRGADAAAMHGAVSTSGNAVGVLSEGLIRSLRDRAARQHVLDGNLCLTSPFDPEITFRTANAMARNKIVYCLAELALVVSSSSRTGGTWAGALEALRAGWTPVYVRGGQTAPPGNHGLIAEGGLPAPFNPSSEPVDFIRWLEGRVSNQDIQGTRAPSSSNPDEIFEAVWPILAPFLEAARPASAVAEQFGLEQQQATNWLLRAVNAGLASHDDGRFQAIDERPKIGEQQKLEL
jgi:predicted Rossmann fold nucleotide-binding protein DprA/Smf involved in DNA uptake